ncbi:MAG: peptidylprolyl isomerase [Chthoniobacterales bacterium]
MQISKNKVVSIDYTLTNDKSETLDTSKGREPLAFLHGSGQLIPGLERELEGRAAGDSLKVSIEPADAYGERDDSKTVKVPREQIQGADELTPGTQLRASGPQGEQILTVQEVGETEVTVDANHPLAGERLHFDVDIRDVREATAEELSHGHAHGVGGHQH